MGLLDRLANQAIFHMQLDSTEAVKFIRKQCPRATPEQALEVISQTLLWYVK
jgi:hypothetical protein